MTSRTDLKPLSYETHGGIRVRRSAQAVDGTRALPALRARLDRRRGLLLSSSFETPGRYRRYDLGLCDPPLSFEGRGRELRVRALNARGRVLLPAVEEALANSPDTASLQSQDAGVDVQVKLPQGVEAEELRTRRPSVFGLLRTVCSLLKSGADPHLGLYGAFGYDLVFQLEDLRMIKPRAAAARDLVLYLPDSLLVIDHHRETAVSYHYEFEVDGRSTHRLCREGVDEVFVSAGQPDAEGDHAPGQYAQLVERARHAFARGDLFEVTPSRVFLRACTQQPSQVFERLQRDNPAPFGVLANLGGGEFLIGASPEMFVRVSGRRVETCPIAGTVARGEDALADATQIQQLLSSDKETAELTMCTDVDRNDKARVCEPGSVRVIGRRQIELYSRLIHTVDHIEGQLREGYDALDAFLSHAWAVTVTGAPKQAAMQFIEEQERSARGFYGGAVGAIGFDGGLNTGLTLRTIRLRNGFAEVRAGATLLFDSEPVAEEAETELKASALLSVLRAPCAAPPAPGLARRRSRAGAGKRVLLVDHRDSFVHNLADYFRRTGAAVTTLRAGFSAAHYDRIDPHLVVLSPGPGRPADFDTAATLELALSRHLPVFGVCLGLQAVVEYFGGTLQTLQYPMHGKPSRVCLRGRLAQDLPECLEVGRYHSLVADPQRLPEQLRVTGHSEPDGCVMAVEHSSLPIAAVQFHPESILSAGQEAGLSLVHNVMGQLH